MSETPTLRAACQLASSNWTLSGEQVLRLYKQVEHIRKDMEPEADIGIVAEARMQCAHPNVHFYYTDGARVMGALAATVEAVFTALGATTETEALERVMILQGVATGKLAKRHYAVTSISGAHIGLWSDRETAVAVIREYPGSSLTELYEAHHG